MPPASIGNLALLDCWEAERMNGGHGYHPGDWVIYRKQKHSVAPGPRAKDVAPAPNGEAYTYCVDKYWIVTAVRGDEISLATRRGKRHLVDASDLNLRPARWWERLLFRDRFPHSAESPDSHSPHTA